MAKGGRRVQVTPEIAERWLATSRQKVVLHDKRDRFAAAILAGEWDPALHVRDPVKLYQGALINGNHRLRAVIAAGQPATMWVHALAEELADVADG